MKIRHNKLIYISVILFFIISIINLYNARYLNSFYGNYYIKQTIWFIIGFIILLLGKKINLSFMFKYSSYLYWFNIFLLLLVLFYGRSINGTKAWLDFKFFSLQPSEFMKFSLSLYLIEISQKKESKIINIIKMIIITFIPSILVFLEPDTGAIIFFLIVLSYLIFTKKIKWYYYLLAIILLIGIIIGFIYMYKNHQDLLIKTIGTSFFYRVDRFINFRRNNYQLDLALLSIFSSPLIRMGFKNILIYIPEGATDFIFAFCVGNYGIILGLIIIICYILLLYSLLKKVKLYQNKKTNYLIISFVLILFFQISINILMNIGLVPIIGITLPFLSYGGSSIIVLFLYLTLIINLTSKDNYYHKVHSKNKNNFPEAYKD